MSHAQILAATRKAQAYTATAKGMAVGAAGNTKFAGDPNTYVGIYGHPRVIFVPRRNGTGYDKKEEVDFRMSREQRASIPPFQTQVVRTDLSPPTTYLIDHSSTHDEFWWYLVLVKHGERQS